MKLFSLIIIAFLINIHLGYGFFAWSSSKCEANQAGTTGKYVKKDLNDVEVINVDEIKEECGNHMNETENTAYCSGFKHVYNPFKDIVHRKHVLSACTRCAQCLAISAEVRKIFDNIIGNKEHLEPNEAKCKVNHALAEEFCKRTFTSHDLRICNGLTMFAKMEEGGTHIRTHFDGQWPPMLKKKCLLFIRQMDVDSKYNFFHQYRLGIKDTDDFLCRGDGVFRECKNLVNETSIINSKSEEPVSFWSSCFF